MADWILTPCNVARSWHWFRQVTAPSDVACGSGIVTVNSPSGSTLQCDTWLWDDMPLNSPKRPPYWNSTSDFDFEHITAVEMSFCTSLRNFIQIGPPSAEKNNVMSIFKMAILAILDFRGPIMGYLKSPCTTSIYTIALDCSVFEKIAFLHFGDRQTNEQMDSSDALSRSRCRERRLNNTITNNNFTRSSAVAERPRDASCHWISVRLSVCPSVTRRYCVETAKHTIKVIFTIG